MLSHSTHIAPAMGARTSSKRLGRGNASGKGGTSGKGGKGQTARAGAKFHPTFEGGQTTIFRASPKKRGFNRKNLMMQYQLVNVSQLEKLTESAVTVEVLLAHRIVRPGHLVKLLGDGEITKKLTVSVHAVSGSARAKIEKAGGSVEILA